MRKIFSLLAVVSIISLGVGYYMYNLPPQNLSKVKPDMRVSAMDLMSSFDADEELANASYLGKVIEVTGIVANVKFEDDGSIQINLESGSLMGGVNCNFESDDASDFNPKPEKGMQVILKGQCTGFLMDVVLERCVIVEINE